MSLKIHPAVRSITLACVAAMLASAAAGAQHDPTVWLALQTSQGAITGESNGRHVGEIQAFAFSVSQPYGAATPVVRVVTSADVAPQVLEALVTNRMLIAPTITLFKQPYPTDSVVYRIRAQRGNVINAALVIDTHHAPSLTIDLLLTGGVSYYATGGSSTNAWSTAGNAASTTASTTTQAVATTPPPTVSGSVPDGAGTQIGGRFTGLRTGQFPDDPVTGQLGGIPLDSVALSVAATVSNGAVVGRPTARPFVIVRPASADAPYFAGAQRADDSFSQINVVAVGRPVSGTPAPRIEIELDRACLIASPSCVTASGTSAGPAGASAGLGGGQRGTAAAPVARIAMPSGTTVMQLRPSVIKVTSRANNTTVTFTP